MCAIAVATDERKAVFTRFVEGHLDLLYSAAFRYARNAGDAEDLVQETLTRAWTHLDASRSEPELRAWMWKILVNLWRDHARRRALRELRPTDPSELPEPEPAPGADHEALRHLARSGVRAAIDTLPEQYRLAVMLADIDGFSYEQIADQLGIRVGTVTSRIRRGRLALRRALWRSAALEGIETDLVCREAASLLAEYCRGETSPAETRFVDSHLKSCIGCQQAERTERELVDALRGYSCHVHAPLALREFAKQLPAL